MAPELDEFVKKNEKFVLKLKLVGGQEQSLIHRIKLPRIASTGSVSYDELAGIAVQYTFPGVAANQEDFTVTFTYYDVDNDCVVIACTDELIDAVEQFQKEGVLRITTEVKRCTTKKKTAPKPTSSSRASAPIKMNASQVQTILESAANVLTSTVETLRGHAQPETPLAPARPAPEPSSDAAAAAPKVPTEPSKAAPEIVAVVPPCEVPPEKIKEEKKPAKKETPPEQSSKKNEEQPKKAPEPEPKPAPVREFIHGRHTCDACLSTPIIGKRYHAINMDDYDLCQKCKDSYKGNEIQFEVVELERDRMFQDRWQKRRAKWDHLLKKGKGHRSCGPRRRALGQKHVGGPLFPAHHMGPHHPPPHHGPPPPHPPPPFGPHRCHPHPPPFGHPPPHPPHEQMDEQLKEAIRQSIEEMKKNDASKASAPVEEPDIVVPPNNEKEPVEDVVVLPPSVCSQVETSDEESTMSSVTKPTMLYEEEAMVEEVDSVDEKSEEVEDSKPPAVPSPSSRSSPKSPKSVNTFSEEAAGNGDVAAALGETFDKCASAINEMVNELGLDDKSETSDDSSEVPYDLATDDEESITEGAEQDPSGGATILESVASPEGADEVASQNSWQVVVEDEQTSGDAMLARAAEMIGSALFDSDMSRSAELKSAHEQVSTLSGSIPSTVPSLSEAGAVTEGQLSRWAPQLLQLREIGIEDDAVCVDILERLYAANIGVDAADEEITAEKVINEYYKRLNMD